MCQSVNNSKWIKSIVLFVLIKVTLGADDKSNQTNDSLLTVHPWLPIGNFTGIIINDNSVNQSYYSYNYIYNVTATLNQHQQKQQSDKVDDVDTNEGETIYQRVGNNNNFSESDDKDNNDNDKVNLNVNPDESSFLDDSPTKEEDYAGGNYGNDDDLIGSEGGNFASQEEDEGLT